MRTLVQDSFNRANGALGTAETGQTWLHSGTRQVVIDTNVAVGAVGGSLQDISYVDAGVTSYTLSAKLWLTTAPGLHCGLVWRVSNGDNYHLIFLYYEAGTTYHLYYYTREAGNWVAKKCNTTLDYYTLAATPEAWITATVVVTPESNKIYLGEDLIAFPSDVSFNASATGVGLLLDAASQAANDFLVTAADLATRRAKRPARSFRTLRT